MEPNVRDGVVPLLTSLHRHCEQSNLETPPVRSSCRRSSIVPMESGYREGEFTLSEAEGKDERTDPSSFVILSKTRDSAAYRRVPASSG